MILTRHEKIGMRKNDSRKPEHKTLEELRMPTPTGKLPTGPTATVATTVLLAAAITEKVLSLRFTT